MTNIKERILNDLIIQEEIEGKSNNIDLIRILLPIINSQKQLEILVKIKFHRYGKSYYQSYRFYYPTELLLNLLNLNNNF